jgi:hypothetical protein
VARADAKFPLWDGDTPTRDYPWLHRDPDAADWDQIVAEVLAHQAAIQSPGGGHNHDDRYYREDEIDGFLATIGGGIHNHDDRYFTETESDNRYALIAHDHDSDYADINHDHDADYSPILHNHDLLYASINHDHDADYAPITHDHPISDILNLQDELDDKANIASPTFTGDVTITEDLIIGNATSTGSTSPRHINLGGTYSSVSGSHPKIMLHYAGAGVAYGIGVSAGKLDYMVPGGAVHVFYVDGVEKARIGSAGELTVANINITGTGGALSRTIKANATGTGDTNGRLDIFGVANDTDGGACCTFYGNAYTGRTGGMAFISSGLTDGWQTYQNYSATYGWVELLRINNASTSVVEIKRASQINSSGEDYDHQVKGFTHDWLFYTDAGTDLAGIGTLDNAPIDASIKNGSIVFWQDETTEELKVRAKKADGTAYDPTFGGGGGLAGGSMDKLFVSMRG